MITDEVLKLLRCPLDPRRETSLVMETNHLLCPRCGLKYPIRDGFPVMVIDEAELPPGRKSLDELLCQHADKGSGSQSPATTGPESL